MLLTNFRDLLYKGVNGIPGGKTAQGLFGKNPLVIILVTRESRNPSLENQLGKRNYLFLGGTGNSLVPAKAFLELRQIPRARKGPIKGGKHRPRNFLTLTEVPPMSIKAVRVYIPTMGFEKGLNTGRHQGLDPIRNPPWLRKHLGLPKRTQESVKEGPFGAF